MIEVTIPGKGETPFNDHEELRDWFAEQHAYWSWARKAANQAPSGELKNNWQQLNAHLDAFDQIRKELSDAIQNQNTAKLDSIVKQISNRLKNINPVWKDSAAGHFLERLRQEHGDRFALSAALQLHDHTQDAKHAFQHEAILLAALFNQGVQCNPEAERTSWEGLVSKHEDELNDLMREHDALTTEIEQAKQVLADLYGETNAAQDTVWKRLRRGRRWWSLLRQRAHDTLHHELELIHKFYREELALRAPVEYWQRKGQQYKDEADKWRWWFFGSAGTMGFLLILFVAATIFGLLYPDAAFVDSLRTRFAALGHLQYALIGAMSVAVVMGVWITRVMGRLYLSSLHQADDAEERVVMINTYLALLESDKALNQTHARELILPTVFRPGADGLVKETGVPAPWLDLVTQLHDARRPEK